MSKTRYTTAQREEALELYLDHGAAETARRTGIALGTLKSWASRSGVASAATETTAAAVEAHRLTVAERKVALARDLMGDIERLRGQLFEPCVERKVVTLAGGKERGVHEVVDVELGQPSFSDQKAIMTTVAIAIDKVQVLTGQATEILEHRVTSPIDEELQRLSEQLEHQQPEPAVEALA